MAKKRKITPKSGMVGTAARALSGRALQLKNQERKAMGLKPLKPRKRK